MRWLIGLVLLSAKRFAVRCSVGFLVVGFLSLTGCGKDPCESVRCVDGNECTEDRCVDGVCRFPPVEDGRECDDKNECTESDVCANGVCTGMPSEDGASCDDDDGNECTAEMCMGGACQSIPVDDGTACGGNDDECAVDRCVRGLCQRLAVNDGAECDDDDGNECTAGLCAEGICAAMPAGDGTACGGGNGGCHSGICDAVVGTFPCSEEGIRSAIAAGGGPYTFDCVVSTGVKTSSEIVINKDVILDGEGKLIIVGGGDHRLFRLAGSRIRATLSGMWLRNGYVYDGNGGSIATSGTLTIHHCEIAGNTAKDTSGHIRGHGGGIYNTGTLTLNECRMFDNAAIPVCDPDVLFNTCGGRGDDIANEGGTVALIDTTADDVSSWSGGTHTSINTALPRNSPSP